MSHDECSGEGELVGSHGKTYEENLREDGGITTLELIFEMFLNPKRRFILYYLQEHEAVTVEELARQIVAWEENVSPGMVSVDARNHVATELVHTHLPKLSDAAFIEYDARSNTVRYTEPPDLLDTVLEFMRKLER